MDAKAILEDQVIHVKRGRMNGLGFEPAFNSYFDFYLDAKWFGEPLLELQDVTFHLYLRKNLNDRNPQWKMPTYRQMKKKFKAGYGKLEAIMRRLDTAHLLKKESGVRRELGLTTRNDYILSDPIPTLEEFLLVASEGVFGLPLLAEWNVISAPTTPAANDELPCPQNGDTDVPEMGTPSVPEMGTYKQTLKNKQTSGESMFEDLKFQIGEKVFNRFMAGATLVSKQDGIAIIGTPQAYARDWIENRLSDKLRRLLAVETVRCVVLEQEP